MFCIFLKIKNIIGNSKSIFTKIKTDFWIFFYEFLNAKNTNLILKKTRL